MEHKVRVSYDSSPRSEHTQVAKRDEGGQSENFSDMQLQMEGELERRRKDWEQEVEKMQEDFFNVKLAKDTSGVVHHGNRTIDVKLPFGGVSRGTYKGDIFEISNAKTLYNERPGGCKVVTFKFDVKGFEPSGITVKTEGSKLTVSAQYDEESYPGSKSSRRHNRQVDIPAGVLASNFTASLSTDGILTLEAPVTEAIPELEPTVIEIPDGRTYRELHGIPPPQIKIGGIGGSGRSAMVPLDVEYEYSSPDLVGSNMHTTHTSRNYRTGPVYLPSATKINRTEIRSTSPRRDLVFGTDQKGNQNTIIQPKRTNVVQSVSPGGTIIVRETENYPPYLETGPLIGTKTYETSSAIGRGALGGKSCYSHPNIISTEEGQRCKINVSIGTAYKPQEISVVLRYRKITVHALHEEVIGDRSTKSEFKREFDIPSEIEPRTFKAVFSPDGNVTIGGSLKTNNNHDAVLALVLCDMPIQGRQCNVSVQ